MIKLIIVVISVLVITGCSSYVRLPSSAIQVYTNFDAKQGLLLAAQNGIMIHIPENITKEFEKSEIDLKCREYKDSIWSPKLFTYLEELRKRPELYQKFHVIEMARADEPAVKIQKDLDGAVSVVIQFVKQESYSKVGFQTKLPCAGSTAEYLGKEIVKTSYEFPSLESFMTNLKNLPDKKEVSRFKFENEFLMYLAERGVIFKFNHELSFEKTSQGKHVMVEILNKLAQDSKTDLHPYLNYWFQQIHENSTQAKLYQMFALMPDVDLKSGVWVSTNAELFQKSYGESDLTYVFINYSVDGDKISSVGLHQLDSCLQGFTKEMSGFKLRKPTSTNQTSYLKPGYICKNKN